jgi:hypothetical protein
MSNAACISSPYLYTADDIFPSMICASNPGTVHPFECKVARNLAEVIYSLIILFDSNNALYVQIMKKLCSTKNKENEFNFLAKCF